MTQVAREIEQLSCVSDVQIRNLKQRWPVIHMSTLSMLHWERINSYATANPSPHLSDIYLRVYKTQSGGTGAVVTLLTSAGAKMTQKLLGGVLAAVGLLLLVVQAQGRSLSRPAANRRPLFDASSTT